jgi:hypothetical protein
MSIIKDRSIELSEKSKSITSIDKLCFDAAKSNTIKNRPQKNVG